LGLHVCFPKGTTKNSAGKTVKTPNLLNVKIARATRIARAIKRARTFLSLKTLKYTALQYDMLFMWKTGFIVHGEWIVMECFYKL
jgi:hypothetical protein